MDIKKEEFGNQSLNRRTNNRYIINAVSIGDIGSIVEISKGGMRIEKLNGEEITGPKLIVPFFKKELNADIVWQDKKNIGIKYAADIDVGRLIKALARKIKGPDFMPEKIISDDDIAGITETDVLSCCINLMEELENINTDMTKLRAYIEDISDLCQETFAPEEKKSEEAGEIKELQQAEPEELKGLLIHEASSAGSSVGIEITDVGFAIARLGLESVRRISTNFLRKKISELYISPLTNFNNYESFVIFKTVIFKHLTHFFGFKDEEGKGSLLLSFETKGIEMLMSVSPEDSADLREYYTSPSKVYSEISRIYEKNNFGRDLLLMNKSHVENIPGRFGDLYDGYILAYHILNPCYLLDSNVKLFITGRKLIYSFMVYLTFLAAKGIMDKDKESAAVLMHMLKRAGMDEREIMDFLNDGVSEANRIMKNLGLKDNIKSSSLPPSSFKIEGYLRKDIYSQYLIKSFKDFSMLDNINRMALRYEDETYAHFILTKLLLADDIGLNSKAYCVIPCKNISELNPYIDEYSYFDILIFKDIDSLSISHRKGFVKLWKSFEGKIIVTFSNYSFMDFDNEDLYLLLKNHIVDFPSYFANREIYERMIDHTIDYVKPYMGKHGVDKSNYLSDIFLMDYIKTNELKSYG